MNINTKAVQTGAGQRWHFSPAALALAFAGAVGTLGMANTAQADTLYQTRFENPPFVNGGPLLGIDGWSTAIPPFLNPDAATITNTIAKSGRQSVEVLGANLVSSFDITKPYDSIGLYRHPVAYTMLPTSPVARVDADLRITTAKPKTKGDFFGPTINMVSGNSEILGEIGLSSEGTVGAYDFGAPPGSKPKFSTTIRFNRWYHLTILHDFVKHTTTYYIDEHRLGKISTTSTSNILLRGNMVVYALPDNAFPDLGSFRADYTARFDNFRISVHNEAPEID
jgi:hypothetical protein